MPMAPGPRRNCYTICRPWNCAGLLFPHAWPDCCQRRGDRGCLTGDHLTNDVLRYPGFNLPARAILMAPNPSVHPSVINYLPAGNCILLVLLILRTAQWPHRAPLSGSQPRRPSCNRSGLEPHCRTSRCARPQPTPSPRYRSTSFTAGYCYCELRVLLLPLYCEPLCIARDLTERHVSAASPVACPASALA